MVFYKHSKVEMIITKVSKEPAPSVNETINAELAKLTKRRKQWENKLKRATTAIKKIDKKIKRLEKRAEREGEEGEGND
jgi:prefoldin subunit 5